MNINQKRAVVLFTDAGGRFSPDRTLDDDLVIYDLLQQHKDGHIALEAIIVSGEIADGRGNGEERRLHVQHIVDLAGIPVPVLAGTDARDHVYNTRQHTLAQALGIAEEAAPRALSQAMESAVRAIPFLSTDAHAPDPSTAGFFTSQHPVTALVIGPMTEVARAIAQHGTPEIFEDIHYMSGITPDGKRYSTRNYRLDPVADSYVSAQAALGNVPIHFYTSALAEDIRATGAFMRYFADPANTDAAAQYICEEFDHLIRTRLTMAALKEGLLPPDDTITLPPWQESLSQFCQWFCPTAEQEIRDNLHAYLETPGLLMTSPLLAVKVHDMALPMYLMHPQTLGSHYPAGELPDGKSLYFGEQDTQGNVKHISEEGVRHVHTYFVARLANAPEAITR